MVNPDDWDTGLAMLKANEQIAHVDATLKMLMTDATNLIAQHGETGAWALLAVKLAAQLADRQQFLAEMLSRMAIKEATR